MCEIDKKDIELYKKKEEEYKETLNRIKEKREEYDKIYFHYDLKGITNIVDSLKKNRKKSNKELNNIKLIN